MGMERKRSFDIAKLGAGRASSMRAGVTDALALAFFAEWARSGYAGMSLERVARNAGVGKAALYRRWPDKETMASELLSCVGLAITEISDQGSFLGDIRALLFAIRRVLRHPTIRRIVADLHAEIGRTPALAVAIRPFQAARRSRVETIIDRAVLRGELPFTIDRMAIADLVGAPLYWRIVVLGERPDRAHVDRLAKMIVAAATA